MSLNIKFADGNEFLNYDDDTEYISGCPTCDYGAKYINDVEIDTTHYSIEARFNNGHGYAFSTYQAIRIFAVDLRSMTEDEFIKHIDEEFYKFDALTKFEVHKKTSVKGA